MHGMGAKSGTTTGGKGGYHHGDLRNALIDAATELARDGGPEAVVLRAAARRVGVTPTAAYRHFADRADLLHAVRERGRTRLIESLEAAGGAVTLSCGEPGAVEERVRAMGRGYIAFALEEPGLFRTAFCRTSPAPAPHRSRPRLTAEGEGWRHRSLGPVTEALDALVEAGLMPAERREGAEVTAWATIHGLAVLALDGPLSRLPAGQLGVAVEQALSAVIAGLTAP